MGLSTLPLVIRRLGERDVAGVIAGLWLVATTPAHREGGIFRKGPIRLRTQTPVEAGASPCLQALHVLTGRTQPRIRCHGVRHRQVTTRRGPVASVA